MNKQMQMKLWVVGTIVLGLVAAGPLLRDASSATFDSGSSCAFGNVSTCLGAFSPAVNTTVPLPANGILNYSTFTVPRGVTVTFQKNTNNTPVIILASGDATVYGNIVLNGTSATNSGTSGNSSFGDDAQPGIGGPGGFDGGYGGYASLFGGAAGQAGGAGKGPGGGQTTSGLYNGDWGYGGGGGSFGTAGGTGSWIPYAAAGPTYGQSSLLPLLGGSGGGGGSAGASFSGAGGGGGGGAIMIASSGTIYVGVNNWQGSCYISNGGICNGITGGSWGVYGRIYADGGAGGSNAGNGQGGAGGGGSGGAIRLVANTITRGDEGYLEALGGGGGGASGGGGSGGNGWIRIEGTTSNWVNNTSPGYTFGLPGHALVPNNPTLSIVSVTPTSGSQNGTVANVPANPRGNADITFPTGTTTATVSLAATNIPVGTTVTVYVVPANGATRTSTLSNALAGSNSSSTATATVTLSPGNNVLMAAATYTVTEIIAMNLPTFDNGERVAKIRVEGGMDGKSRVTYITASGKEYPAGKAKVQG